MRRAEPHYCSGVFIETDDHTVNDAVVFAYRRGGAWALMDSRQGLRISDAHTLWSWDRGGRRGQSTSSPPGYHSGSLRDMLIPRYRTDFFEDRMPRRERDWLTGEVESVTVAGRQAWRVNAEGSAMQTKLWHLWQLHIDADTGVVLREETAGARGAYSRGFTAIDLTTPLPDELFDWGITGSPSADRHRS
jgi:hypothetical protein